MEAKLCNNQQQTHLSISSFQSMAASGILAAFATTSFRSNKLKNVMN
jgi:hypothetical protein